MAFSLWTDGQVKKKQKKSAGGGREPEVPLSPWVFGAAHWAADTQQEQSRGPTLDLFKQPSFFILITRDLYADSVTGRTITIT